MRRMIQADVAGAKKTEVAKDRQVAPSVLIMVLSSRGTIIDGIAHGTKGSC